MSAEHIKALSNNKNFLLKGIFSRSLKKIKILQNKYSDLKNYGSIKDLYLKTKSDLLIVSVSEEEYKKIIKKIIEFPWVCLAEKPLGLNFKEIRSTYKLIKKKKRKIFVSLNRRFYTSTNELKKILNNFKSKRKITIIDCQNRDKFKEGAKKIGVIKSSKSIKYLMYSNSVHLVDYINYFCRGDLIKINGNNNWKINKPKDFICNMKFSSGDEVIYKAYWTSFKKWEVRIRFNKHNLSLKPLEKLNMSESFPRIKKINYKQDIDFKPGLISQSKEIVNFFLGKKNKLVSIENYMKTAKLIKKIYNV